MYHIPKYKEKSVPLLVFLRLRELAALLVALGGDYVTPATGFLPMIREAGYNTCRVVGSVFTLGGMNAPAKASKEATTTIGTFSQRVTIAPGLTYTITTRMVNGKVQVEERLKGYNSKLQAFKRAAELLLRNQPSPIATEALGLVALVK